MPERTPHLLLATLSLVIVAVAGPADAHIGKCFDDHAWTPPLHICLTLHNLLV